VWIQTKKYICILTTVHVAPSTEAYLAEFFKLLDATKTPLTSVSIPDIFFLGGGILPPKTYNSLPPNGY